MRVLFDNNVIIDSLKPNAEFEANASELLKLAMSKKINGFISANSLSDIFYVLRKTHGNEKAKWAIKKVTETLEIIGLTSDDCIVALDSPMSDFEDALVEVCAIKSAVDYIVTRDEKFLNTESKVKKIIPSDFLTLQGIVK